MNKLLEIRENKVFVEIEGEMKETNDCRLIGETVLQLAKLDSNVLYDKYKAVLDEFLEKHKFKKTPERYAILKEVCVLNKTFTIKELFFKMENKYRVSMATLYNTAKILLECEVIKPNNITDSVELFQTTHFKLQNQAIT